MSNFPNFKIPNCKMFKMSTYTTRLPFGSTNKRKVVTKIFLYKSYRKILFQKVASGYLLHFVQDGSSKNALETQLLRKHVKQIRKFEKCLHIPPHSLYRCHTSGGVRRLATLALHFSLGGPLLCIGPGGLCEGRAAGGPQQTSGI